MDELVIQGEKEKRFIIDLNDSLQTRYELVRELKLSGTPKEGYRISARSVARVLSEHGVTIKKTKLKS